MYSAGQFLLQIPYLGYNRIMKNVRKPIPDPREYPILPPDMNYIYFENAHLFPFEPENREFSLINSWWLSECSFLVYSHPGFARMAMKLAGFENFYFFQGKGTECMVSWNRDAIIVSFRGTEMKSLSAFHEMRTNLNTVPADFEKGGKVHRGFLNGLEEIWDGDEGLKHFLESLSAEAPKRPMWICGHSLGGALAALCFARMENATGLYIFGAPRIGDQMFVDQFERRPVWRIEHGRDPIPMVPLDVPNLNFNFKDLGELVFLNSHGELSSERPVISAEEEKEKVLTTISEQKKRRESLSPDEFKDIFDKEKAKELIAHIGDHLIQAKDEWVEYFDSLDKGIGLRIQDHMPIYYCSKLWNNLEHSAI